LLIYTLATLSGKWTQAYQCTEKASPACRNGAVETGFEQNANHIVGIQGGIEAVV
jgi:Asp-tRNA(Asn)/Glu-tRNA(Gln) amidotransferase B subunit